MPVVGVVVEEHARRVSVSLAVPQRVYGGSIVTDQRVPPVCKSDAAFVAEKERPKRKVARRRRPTSVLNQSEVSDFLENQPRAVLSIEFR